jgi:hypothetical protein
LTRTFNGKSCQTYNLTCSGCAPLTKTCCAPGTEVPRVCLDCVECSITCGGCSFGGGGGCALAPGPQETVAVALDREPRPIAVPKSSFILTRTEAGENGVTFLMDEWAVVAHSTRPGGASPGIEVLKASSPAFAAAKARDMEQGARLAPKRNAAGPAGSRETVLIVEAPVHPHNSRLAPTPKLSLSATDVPAGVTANWVLVRADFSEAEDAPSGLQLLDSDGRVPPSLLALLKEHFALVRHDIKRHRTVVFAMVNIGDALELRTLATVMPKCCCGGVHCV